MTSDDFLCPLSCSDPPFYTWFLPFKQPYSSPCLPFQRSPTFFNRVPWKTLHFDCVLRKFLYVSLCIDVEGWSSFTDWVLIRFLLRRLFRKPLFSACNLSKFGSVSCKFCHVFPTFLFGHVSISQISDTQDVHRLSQCFIYRDGGLICSCYMYSSLLSFNASSSHIIVVFNTLTKYYGQYSWPKNKMMANKSMYNNIF